ncbi:MAG: hypothetical protein K1X89_15685, partial [Myxococcaceae bacterium]|nr:hypothetical protein [Myxococcaceae bacterium]
MTPGVHQDEDRLLELAYGELPAHEASAVEAHVRGCARCAASLEQIRKVRATMKQLEPVSAPDAGLDSLLAYAEQQAKRNAAGPSRAAPWWRRFLAPVATVAALGLVVVVTYKNQNDLQAPSPAEVAAETKRSRDVEQAKTAAAQNEYGEGKNAELVASPSPPAAALAPAAKDSASLDEGNAFALGDSMRKAGKIANSREDVTADKKAVDEVGTYAQKAKAPAKPSKSKQINDADQELAQGFGLGSSAGSLSTGKSDAPKVNAAPPPAPAVVAAKPPPAAGEPAADYSNAAQRRATKSGT